MAQMQTSVLRKTKMCRFNAIGKCQKGKACGFAHATTELRPMPDLSYTKICPLLRKSGSCDDSCCRFAHQAGRSQRRALVHLKHGVVDKANHCINSARPNASAHSMCNNTVDIIESQDQHETKTVNLCVVVSQNAACIDELHTPKVHGERAVRNSCVSAVCMDTLDDDDDDDDISTCDLSWTPGTSAESSAQESHKELGNFVSQDNRSLQNSGALQDSKQLHQKPCDMLHGTKMHKLDLVGLCTEGSSSTSHSLTHRQTALNTQCSNVCDLPKQIDEVINGKSAHLHTNTQTCNQAKSLPSSLDSEGAGSYNALQLQLQQCQRNFELPYDNTVLVVRYTFLNVEPEKPKVRRASSASATYQAI